MNRPRVTVFVDTAGEYRFRVVAANGETVSTSEGYTRRVDAVRGARALRRILRLETTTMPDGESK